ncbi:HK97-gp10 family putative phage morphogenesis protein [Rapidithrix thailandica]|uniref:HK97-gp10 family putative phage morphogenesis protein n=1 Tax=Rapidithrix thailandica TaxID=413964 RepID=A0AAW9S8H0_9BACT
MGVKLKNWEQAKRMLKDMDNRMTKKVIEGTMRKAAKPLVRSAKSKAPKGDTGNLRKSIGTFVSKSSERKKNLKAGIWAGPRTRGSHKGFHAHLIEFGTKKRKPTKGEYLVFEVDGVLVFAKEVAPVKPQPFMQPAYQESKGQMEQVMFKEFGNEFQKVAKKYK